MMHGKTDDRERLVEIRTELFENMLEEYCIQRPGGAKRILIYVIMPLTLLLGSSFTNNV